MGQAETDPAFGDFDIAVVGLNFSRVLPTLLARTVGFGIINCLDAQLLGQRMQSRPRKFGQ